MAIYGDSNSNNNVMGLLNMLSDPGAFKEKLRTLEETEKMLDAKIALAGEADQILVMKQVIQEREAESVQMIREAGEKAQAVIEAANGQGDTIIQDARMNAERMIEAAVNQKNQILADAQSKLEMINQDAQQTQLKSAQREETLQVEATRLNELKHELDQRQLGIIEKELALTNQQAMLDRKNNLLATKQDELDDLQEQIKVMVQAMKEDLDNLKIK